MYYCIALEHGIGGEIDCDCNKSQKNFNFIPFIMKRIRDPTALHHDSSGSWY